MTELENLQAELKASHEWEQKAKDHLIEIGFRCASLESVIEDVIEELESFVVTETPAPVHRLQAWIAYLKSGSGK